MVSKITNAIEMTVSGFFVEITEIRNDAFYMFDRR